MSKFSLDVLQRRGFLVETDDPDLILDAAAASRGTPAAIPARRDGRRPQKGLQIQLGGSPVKAEALAQAMGLSVKMADNLMQIGWE